MRKTQNQVLALVYEINRLIDYLVGRQIPEASLVHRNFIRDITDMSIEYRFHSKDISDSIVRRADEVNIYKKGKKSKCKTFNYIYY
jgi:hypothetical protein